MTSTRASPVARHRQKQKKRGLMRLELLVKHADAPLFRRVARALQDEPAKAELVRAKLKSTVPGESAITLLDSLACDLPDEVFKEILNRPKHAWRKIDL